MGQRSGPNDDAHPPTLPPRNRTITVLLRIRSTTGINKITKTMKMVAASKMRGDEDRLKNGRPFQVGRCTDSCPRLAHCPSDWIDPVD